MTYRGKVQNGVVVFDGAVPPEGTTVTIKPTQALTAPPRGSPEGIVSEAELAGDPHEFDRMREEMREEDEAAMQAIQELWERRRSSGNAETT